MLNLRAFCRSTEEGSNIPVVLKPLFTGKAKNQICGSIL
jgi:hypothetical protein